jgi:hypothetical protein
MKEIMAKLAFIGITIGGCLGLIALLYAVMTVFFYYAINFTLGAFNTGHELTWAQALGVTVIVNILKSIFGGNKGAK